MSDTPFPEPFDIAELERERDALRSTIYRFHYVMQDLGWHPGRTDDDLLDLLKNNVIALRSELVDAQSVNQELLTVLCIVRGKHGCGALTLPQSDLERVNAVIAKVEKA